MEKQIISILVLTPFPASSRWIAEQERLNEENPEYFIKIDARPPIDFQLLIPEDSEAQKTVSKNRKLNFRTIENNPQGTGIKYDAVVPRIAGKRLFQYGCNVVRHLSLMGTYTTAPALALETCSNKWKTSQLLALHGLPIPDQLLLNSVDNLEKTLELVKGLPAIGKLTHGSQGAAVFILNDVLATKTALSSMEKLEAEITLNRFVKTSTEENEVKDFRVWVLNGTTNTPEFYAMQRTTNNDFRANLSLAGKGTKAELTSEEKEICAAAARAFNMDFVAVDFVRDVSRNNAPFILELNGNPGTKIEHVLNENLLGKVFDMTVKKVIEGRKSGADKKAVEPKEPTHFVNSYNAAGNIALRETKERVTNLLNIVSTLKGASPELMELIKANLNYILKKVDL